MSMKNPLTPAGIEPAAFRFVAQHLNHCATVVPSNPHILKRKSETGYPRAKIMFGLKYLENNPKEIFHSTSQRVKRDLCSFAPRRLSMAVN